ncbi:hypothetical protein M8C21_025184 [Ambrosia artemisiifolia]|uniref:Uncharacterized protein n=1 Tax=Ambrosia artemisiifolia TaxID=4212 RepID=A0AAD5G2V3_AMBAR|nr:hypothetical protein M8C21_025184 [Ambrosia artemisiifolia]
MFLDLMVTTWFSLPNLFKHKETSLLRCRECGFMLFQAWDKGNNCSISSCIAALKTAFGALQQSQETSIASSAADDVEIKGPVFTTV